MENIESIIREVIGDFESRINDRFDIVNARLMGFDEQIARLTSEQESPAVSVAGLSTATTIKESSPNVEEGAEKEKESEFKIHGADKVSTKSALKTPKKSSGDDLEPQTL